jgi:glyceraldehyde 3-phosphate dehydrogenase
LKAGAKKVVISAPAKDDETATLVIGANEDSLAEAGDVISNASCTTNSIAAVMAIMEMEFGVEKAMLTTVHSYTATQVLHDGPSQHRSHVARERQPNHRRLGRSSHDQPSRDARDQGLFHRGDE